MIVNTESGRHCLMNTANPTTVYIYLSRVVRVYQHTDPRHGDNMNTSDGEYLNGSVVNVMILLTAK